MRSLTERDIRASFMNASRTEVPVLSLPPAFSGIDFSSHDFLGCVDGNYVRRAHVVTEVEDALTGFLLHRAEQCVLARAPCYWCEDVTLRNDVQFYAAHEADAVAYRARIARQRSLLSRTRP